LKVIDVGTTAKSSAVLVMTSKSLYLYATVLTLDEPIVAK